MEAEVEGCRRRHAELERRFLTAVLGSIVRCGVKVSPPAAPSAAPGVRTPHAVSSTSRVLTYVCLRPRNSPPNIDNRSAQVFGADAGARGDASPPTPRLSPAARPAACRRWMRRAAALRGRQGGTCETILPRNRGMHSAIRRAGARCSRTRRRKPSRYQGGHGSLQRRGGCRRRATGARPQKDGAGGRGAISRIKFCLVIPM